MSRRDFPRERARCTRTRAPRRGGRRKAEVESSPTQWPSGMRSSRGGESGLIGGVEAGGIKQHEGTQTRHAPFFSLSRLCRTKVDITCTWGPVGVGVI